MNIEIPAGAGEENKSPTELFEKKLAALADYTLRNQFLRKLREV